MEVADLPAIARACGEVPLLVDSTFATPALLKPLEHGAKLVFHSASKYLNGHGDVMLGVVVGDANRVRKIKGLASLFGVNANPYECWLASRGLRHVVTPHGTGFTNSGISGRTAVATPGGAASVLPGSLVPSLEGAGRHTPPARRWGDAGVRDSRRGCGSQRSVQATPSAIPFSPTLADARTTVSYPTGTSHKFHVRGRTRGVRYRRRSRPAVGGVGGAGGFGRGIGTGVGHVTAPSDVPIPQHGIRGPLHAEAGPRYAVGSLGKGAPARRRRPRGARETS